MKWFRLRFRKYALFLLFYSLMVILWGAWVRISHSGDGCGESWPLCQGELIPQAKNLPTWIEFSHRLSSGLFGLFVIGLVIWAFRAYSRGHWVRRTALVTLLFTITEALLGARLVLAGLVGSDASAARALTMALHMVNSLLLTGSVALVYFWSRYEWPRRNHWPTRWKVASSVLIIVFLLICCTGAVAALSSTLFPSDSLLAGLQQDISSNGHFLIRLRISHPLMATSLSLLMAGIAALFLRSFAGNLKAAFGIVRQFLVVLLIAVVFGYITLFSLSPIWMKLTHLLLAHAVWVALLAMLVGLWTRDGEEGSHAKRPDNRIS